MELKRTAYTVTVETSDDNPVPTSEDVSRNVLKLREDFPDAAVFVTQARDIEYISTGVTWAQGYESVKMSLLQTIDNNHAVYEKVLSAVQAVSVTLATPVRQYDAASAVYRIISAELLIRPMGKRSNQFRDEFMDTLFMNPDNHPELWTEIGQYYLDKASEGA